MNWIQRILFYGIVLVASCQKSDDIPAIYELNVILGDNQNGLQHEELADEIILELSSEKGEVAPNVELNFSGDGYYSPNSTITNDEGRIQLKWTLGEEYNQSLKVSVRNSPKSYVTLHAKAKYNYQQPMSNNDGWDVGDIRNYLVDSKTLFDGIDQIRKGNFIKIHSLLLVKDKKLLLEEYYPGYTSSGEYKDFNINTKHEVQSASKSFRSALIGIAIDNGIIEGVDVPIYSFFPGLSSIFSEEKEKITLEHILTMSSGLQWDEKSNTSTNDLAEMYSKPYNQWVSYVLDKPVQYAPGTKFVYNTGASIMLNNIIVSRTNFENFVRTKYADMVKSSDLPGVGNPLAGTTTPRDMAKLGYVFLYDGYWKTTKVVSKTWIDQSTQKVFEVEPGLWYGYQWWIKSLATSKGTFEVIFANGNGGQFIMYIKEIDLLVVSTGGNFFSNKMWQIYDLLSAYIIPSVIE